MRFAALAALSILVVLPADALQQSQYASLTPTCDNDGRCTTLNAIAPVTATHDSWPEIKTTTPIPAAGLSCARSMPTATAQAVLSYPVRQARELALESRTPHVSRRTLMILKTITARACCSWAASVPGAVHPPASIHAGRRWMYANSDVAWLTDVAICPIGSPWAALRLRTVCSKAGGGAIRTTVTPRSM